MTLGSLSHNPSGRHFMFTGSIDGSYLQTTLHFSPIIPRHDDDKSPFEMCKGHFIAINRQNNLILNC